MTVFDLLFIAVFVGTMVILVLAGLAAIRGRRARALAWLRRLGVMASVYLGIVILVSLVSPRRVLNLGEEQCSDDWCIAVTRARHHPAGDARLYEVTFRISSRARGRAQRERGVRVYLMDSRGRCYDPILDQADAPFDRLLQPQEAVNIGRVFNLPVAAPDPVLVVSREGWFPGLFIIGDSGSLFHKRAVVRLE
jgi:hypothetical protein